MSKRFQPGPHTDRSKGIDFNMSSTPDDKPQRATAAQLASRKIKTLNKRSRPNLVSAPSGHQQQPFTPFNSIDPNTVAASSGGSNGFTFGQSQSFPGAASVPSQNGTQQPVNFGSGGSPGFNFSTSFDSGPSFSNPFANLNGAGPNPGPPPTSSSSFSGFQGNLFNIPSSTTSTQNQPAKAATSSTIFGSQPAQSRGTGLFTTPNNNQPSSGASIFQTTPATTGAATGNMFAQASTQGSNPFNFTNTSQKTSPFGQSPSVKDQSLFGSTGDNMQISPDARNKADTSKPGDATSAPPPAQPIFGAQSTSASPAKPPFGTSISEMAENKKSFSLGTGLPTLADSGKSLFDRVSKPDSSQTTTAPIPAPAAPTFSATHSLFGQTGKPSETPQTTTAITPAKPAPDTGNFLFGQPKTTEPQTTAAATPTHNPFGSLFGRNAQPGDNPQLSASATPTPTVSSASGFLFSQPKSAEPQTTAASTLAQPFGSLFEQNSTAGKISQPTTSAGSSIFAEPPKSGDPNHALTTPSPTKNPLSTGNSHFGRISKSNEISQVDSAPTSANTTSTAGGSLFAQPAQSGSANNSVISASTKTELSKPAFGTPAKETMHNMFATKTSTTISATPSSKLDSHDSVHQFANKGPSDFPHNTSGELKEAINTEYRIRMLNYSFQRKVSELNSKTDSFDALILYYMRVRDIIGLPVGTVNNSGASKRKHRDEDDRVRESSPKKIKATEHVASVNNVNGEPPALPSSSFQEQTNKRKAVEDADSSSNTGVQPAKRTNDSFKPASQTASIFASSFSNTSLQKPETPSFKPSASESSVSHALKPTPSFGFTPSSQSTGAVKVNGSSSPTFTVNKNAEIPSKPTFQPPKLGSGQSTNFLAQFGKQAAKEADKEKAKRKAEDFDSDEDDEAEWERKDAEDQRKKQKSFDDIATKRAKFIPGKGFVFDDESESQNIEKAGAADTEHKPSSIFDNQRSTHTTSNNLFGHLSASNSPTKDDIDEESEAEGAKLAAPPSSNGGGRSLFDRIQMGSDGKPLREASDDEKKTTDANTSVSGNLFGTPQKPMSPFFNSTTPKSAPNTTSSSFLGNTGSTFGPSVFGSTSLVGASSSTPKSHTTPFSNPFGNTGALAAPQATATSGLVSNSDTGADDTDGEHSNDPQVNLIGKDAAENEEVTLETRARALKFQSRSGWNTQGVGLLRILVNKVAGRARIVLRADPSGKVVLNTAVQKAVDYKVSNNSVQCMVPRADGSGIDSWALRVKTKEDAEELGQALRTAKECLQG